MTRSLKNNALTGLAALATAVPLAGCGTAQPPAPQPAVSSVPTPKWFEGGLEVVLSGDQSLEPAQGTTLTYTDAQGEQRTAYLTFVGAETPRTIATIDGQPLTNDASQERVHLENGDFYDSVSVGTKAGERLTQSELEDTVAGIVGSEEFFGENRFYAVLGKDADGNYNAFHSYGAIAGPDAVRQAIDELYTCATAAGASGELGDVRVRVLQGSFDGPETTYGAVMEAYDTNGACIAQMLIGNDAEIAPIAQRASGIAYDLAPIAAAEAYLTND